MNKLSKIKGFGNDYVLLDNGKVFSLAKNGFMKTRLNNCGYEYKWELAKNE